MVKPLRNSADWVHAYQEGYEQALDDFGVAQLLLSLRNVSTSDFEQQWLSGHKQELECLAAMLIQWLSANLQESLITDYLKAIRQEDAAVISSWRGIDSLPRAIALPAQKSLPLFWLGDCLSWKPLGTQAKTDFGVVVGYLYLPAAHRAFQWSWKYLILLDKDSPSSAWTVVDAAWEEDLQPVAEEDAK